MGWLSYLAGTTLSTLKIGRATLDASGLNAARTLTLPNASGRLVLSDATTGNVATGGGRQVAVSGAFASVTLDATQHHLHALPAGSAITLTLPNPVTSEGRRYTVSTDGTAVVTVSPGLAMQAVAVSPYAASLAVVNTVVPHNHYGHVQRQRFPVQLVRVPVQRGPTRNRR